MKYLLLLMLPVLLLPACGRKEKPAAPPATGTATPAEGNLAASRDGLIKLSADTNPYIRNNAKAALESWEARDYTAVAIAMQKIISLCATEAQQTAAMTSLAQLKTEIDAAVAKGDSNAKEAAAQLQQTMR